jgi:hypothetical protein
VVFDDFGSIALKRVVPVFLVPFSFYFSLLLSLLPSLFLSSFFSSA